MSRDRLVVRDFGVSDLRICRANVHAWCCLTDSPPGQLAPTRISLVLFVVSIVRNR
jgi:hypothetical protein